MKNAPLGPRGAPLCIKPTVLPGSAGVNGRSLGLWTGVLVWCRQSLVTAEGAGARRNDAA